MTDGVMRRLMVLATVGVIGCAGEPDAPQVESLTGPLFSGTLGHRRELVSGGCTGTILGRRWVLRAAHCLTDGYDGVDGGGEGPYWPTVTAPSGGVTASTDGINWTTVLPIERTFSLAHEAGAGIEDVQLLRLAAPGVPPTFLSTFPTLATARPSDGQVVTQWGAGCSEDGDGGVRWDGRMRFATFTYPSTEIRICFGDSGGPLRLGRETEGGAVWAVNSGSGGGGDIFGDVVAKRDEILAIMRQWGDGATDVNLDISLLTWCTNPTEDLYWGDINGDGEPDAFCHDRSGGRTKIATSRRRQVLYDRFVASAWCNGADDEMHVGDFDGDGRTDRLCRTRRTGRYRIDLSRFGTFDGASDWDATSGWCSHLGARLHLGDFNGDGVTDLLCKDENLMWVDHARRPASASAPFTAPFAFANLAGNSLRSSWCTHIGAQVFTGDFNGDRRTDLLCLTKGLGDLFVSLAGASGFPFVGTSSFTRGVIRELRPDGTIVDTSDRFCDEPGSVLSIMDIEGNGRSDLVCRRSDGRLWPSVRSMPGGSFEMWGGWLFGWNSVGSVRPRLIQPASQPWQRRQVL